MKKEIEFRRMTPSQRLSAQRALHDEAAALQAVGKELRSLTARDWDKRHAQRLRETRKVILQIINVLEKGN